MKLQVSAKEKKTYLAIEAADKGEVEGVLASEEPLPEKYRDHPYDEFEDILTLNDKFDFSSQSEPFPPIRVTHWASKILELRKRGGNE